MIAFVAGVLLVLACLSPWADAASDRTLTAHMLQHMGLTMVAAPLLAYGLPAKAVLRRLSVRAGRALVRLANPIALWTVFVAAQWAVHFTPLYERAAEDGWIHAAEHALFLGTGIAFWWSLFGKPPRVQGPARALYVALAMPATGAIGVVLMASNAVRYPHYASLADQHSAGAVMWVASSLLMVGALVVAVWGWLKAEERRALAAEAYGR